MPAEQSVRLELLRIGNRNMGRIIGVCVVLLYLSSCASNPKSRNNKIYNSANAHIELAIAYLSDGNTDAALEQMQKSEDIAARNPELDHAYAIYYQRIGENEKSEQRFISALRVEPSNPRYNNNYGVLLSQLGKYEEASKKFQAAYSQKKYDSRAEAYENYGDIKRREGEYSASINAYNEALKINPDWFIIHLKIAQVRYNEGRFVDAYRRFSTYMISLEKINVLPSKQDIELGLGIAASIKDYEKVTEYQQMLENIYPN